MKHVILNHYRAELTDQLAWKCEDQLTALLLNEYTRDLKAEYSPSRGFIRDYLFNEVVSHFEITESFDNDVREESTPDVEY